MRVLGLMLWPALAIAVTSIAFARPEEASIPWKEVTLTDAGKTVNVKVGTGLAVRLEMVAGTGYGWDISKNDAKRLKLCEKPSTETPHKNGDVVGGKEIRLFRFKALKAGKTDLELRYARPWEKNKPPAKLFKLHVNVVGGR